MKNYVLIPMGLVTGFINGLLGTGGGTILVVVSEIFGVKPKTAHATALSVILPMSLLSIYLYFKSGSLDLWAAAVTGAAGAAGGFTGAKLLKKTPDKWLKILFGVTTAVLGVIMLVKKR